jgi:hypothetical protein
MSAARDQSRRLPPTAAADQHQRPDEINDAPSTIEGNAKERRHQRTRVLPGEPCLTPDGERRHQHERALDHGAEIFDLLVPVRMIIVRRLLAKSDGAQRAKRCDDVDYGFQWIGVEGNAASQPIRSGFQGKDDDAYAQAAPGNPKAAAHSLVPVTPD